MLLSRSKMWKMFFSWISIPSLQLCSKTLHSDCIVLKRSFIKSTTTVNTLLRQPKETFNNLWPIPNVTFWKVFKFRTGKIIWSCLRGLCRNSVHWNGIIIKGWIYFIGKFKMATAPISQDILMERKILWRVHPDNHLMQLPLYTLSLNKNRITLEIQEICWACQFTTLKAPINVQVQFNLIT